MWTGLEEVSGEVCCLLYCAGPVLGSYSLELWHLLSELLYSALQVCKRRMIMYLVASVCLCMWLITFCEQDYLKNYFVSLCQIHSTHTHTHTRCIVHTIFELVKFWCRLLSRWLVLANLVFEMITVTPSGDWDRKARHLVNHTVGCVFRDFVS